MVSTQDISKSIASPTSAIQHRLLATPQLSDSQTVLNVAAIEGLNAPVTVKEPSPTDNEISQGPPNQGDAHLLSDKPQGTDILRQWYINTKVEKYVHPPSFPLHNTNAQPPQIRFQRRLLNLLLHRRLPLRPQPLRHRTHQRGHQPHLHRPSRGMR